MTKKVAEDPFVARVLIDKISLTVNIPEHAQQGIIDTIKGLDYAKRVYPSGTYYNYSVSLDLSDICGAGCIVLIQLKPNRNGINNTRIEFNPGAFNMDGRTHLGQVLRHIFGEHMSLLLNQSRITRLDVAIDIANLHIDDFFFDARQHKRDRAVFHDQHFQTIYFGESLVIYDKKAEQEHMNITTKHAALTRIEYRHKNLQHPICGLIGTADHLLNSFKQVKTYNTSALVKMKAMPPVFIDSCHWRGIGKALQIMSPTDKEHFSSLMKHARWNLLNLEDLSIRLDKSIARVISIFLEKTKTKGKIKGKQSRLSSTSKAA